MEENNEIVKNSSISKEFILEHAGNGLGAAVYTCEEAAISEYARKAATICRRRFRPEDVLFISVLDEEEKGDAGVAFTSKGIYCWEEDDSFTFSVEYPDILNVDYDSNGVRVMFNQDPARFAASGVGDKRIGGFLTRIADNISEMQERTFSRIIPCVCYDNDLDEEEEKEYIREMYNFISDIVEEINS